MASVIGPWIDMINNNIAKSSCVLSMTDSTTSAGWIRRSNFSSKSESPKLTKAKLMISRSHAKRMMQYNIKEYSQWFPGVYNVVADSLSRDHHLTNSNLVQIFRSQFRNQIPRHFDIYDLPQEVEYWICALLQRLPDKLQSPEVHRGSNIELGIVGKHSFNPLIFPRIYFSKCSQQHNEQQSFLRSPRVTDKPSTLDETFLQWVKEQSGVPWTMWHRPSRCTNIQTHGSIPTKSHHDFYKNNSKDTKMRTHHLSDKKHFPLVS